METYEIIPEKIVENINIIITLTNDIYSYSKEIENGEHNNLIIYLMENDESLDYQKASKIVHEKLNDEYHKFNKLIEKYNYKEYLKDLIFANKNWHMITNRYNTILGNNLENIMITNRYNTILGNNLENIITSK